MPKTPKKLDVSPEEMDRLAEITEEDILKVQQRWERYVDAWSANLLLAGNAGTEDGENV